MMKTEKQPTTRISQYQLRWSVGRRLDTRPPERVGGLAIGLIPPRAAGQRSPR